MSEKLCKIYMRIGLFRWEKVGSVVREVNFSHTDGLDNYFDVSYRNWTFKGVLLNFIKKLKKGANKDD